MRIEALNTGGLRPGVNLGVLSDYDVSIEEMYLWKCTCRKIRNIKPSYKHKKCSPQEK